MSSFCPVGGAVNVGKDVGVSLGRGKEANEQWMWEKHLEGIRIKTGREKYGCEFCPGVDVLGHGQATGNAL